MRWFRKLLALLMSSVRTPNALTMRDNTRIKVTDRFGRVHYGHYRGTAPDGSYAVALDENPNQLHAYVKVTLVR